MDNLNNLANFLRSFRGASYKWRPSRELSQLFRDRKAYRLFRHIWTTLDIDGQFEQFYIFFAIGDSFREHWELFRDGKALVINFDDYFAHNDYFRLFLIWKSFPGVIKPPQVEARNWITSMCLRETLELFSQPLKSFFLSQSRIWRLQGESMLFFYHNTLLESFFSEQVVKEIFCRELLVDFWPWNNYDEYFQGLNSFRNIFREALSSSSIFTYAVLKTAAARENYRRELLECFKFFLKLFPELFRRIACNNDVFTADNFCLGR